jgi:hypothetical protein
MMGNRSWQPVPDLVTSFFWTMAMEQCPGTAQHQQMEEGGCMHRVAERRPVQVFRVLVVAACLLAAAVVIGRQGDVQVGLGEYAADTEDNIFSRHYLSPAQRKYRAMHPPPPPPAKPVALTQAPAPATPPRPQLPSLIGYSEKEARTFLQEIPGMQEHEMDELVKAASFGHATPLVDPVAAAAAPPPRPLSPAAIAEEHIRAEDVFSRNYGRPVQTTTESVATLRPDLLPAARACAEIGAPRAVRPGRPRLWAASDCGVSAVMAGPP